MAILKTQEEKKSLIKYSPNAKADNPSRDLWRKNRNIPMPK